MHCFSLYLNTSASKTIIVFVGFALLFLTSCKTSDVVSKGPIQWRKHRPGVMVSLRHPSSPSPRERIEQKASKQKRTQRPLIGSTSTKELVVHANEEPRDSIQKIPRKRLIFLPTNEVGRESIKSRIAPKRPAYVPLSKREKYARFWMILTLVTLGLSMIATGVFILTGVSTILAIGYSIFISQLALDSILVVVFAILKWSFQIGLATLLPGTIFHFISLAYGAHKEGILGPLLPLYALTMIFLDIIVAIFLFYALILYVLSS